MNTAAAATKLKEQRQTITDLFSKPAFLNIGMAYDAYFNKDLPLVLLSEQWFLDIVDAYINTNQTLKQTCDLIHHKLT